MFLAQRGGSEDRSLMSITEERGGGEDVDIAVRALKKEQEGK